jgi:signal transduction histidine kinase
LGLSLAKRITEEHHGRSEVQTKLDKGTTFSVMLPLRQAATADGFVLQSSVDR